MEQAFTTILLHNSPNRKGLQPFISVNLYYYWCARQDSNLRPTDS